MEEQCKLCKKKAVESLITERDGRVVKSEHFCARHWVEHEGETCLGHDLEVAQAWADYESIHADVALEIEKQYPKLAQEFGKTLRKIVKGQKRKASTQ